MSYTFSFDSKSSVLEANFHPGIDVSEGQWGLSLLGFQTYHTVPNVSEDNNHFIFKKDGDWVEFHIPVGAYTIDHLKHLLEKKMSEEGILFSLNADVSTQRAIIYSGAEINFES